jgi:hypothetical protein
VSNFRFQTSYLLVSSLKLSLQRAYLGESSPHRREVPNLPGLGLPAASLSFVPLDLDVSSSISLGIQFPFQ